MTAVATDLVRRFVSSRKELQTKMSTKITIPSVRAAKGTRRLAMLTAYDYPSSRLLDEAGVDIILVGDSLGMVVLGDEDTLGVTIEIMEHHTRAVARGAGKALVVGDMPWLSYHVSIEETIRNAAQLVRAGAHAVKIEGGKPKRLEMVQALLDAEIPVMGHVGLTPQSVHALGGFRVQGKDRDAAREVLDEAIALDEAGCFSIVLECVPEPLGRLITERVSVPTIGIGAGPGCDGQVLVYHDLLGLYDGHTPKFVRRYADAASLIRGAVEDYCRDVREGGFPSLEDESFQLSAESDLTDLYGESPS